MKCFVCKFGEIEPGVTTYNLNHDSMTLVVKNVPAGVCDACGEGYLELEVSARLQEIVDEAKNTGVEILVRKYIPAEVSHEVNGTQQQPVEKFIGKLGLVSGLYSTKQRHNGYQLYADTPTTGKGRFGYVRLNKKGKHARMLTVHAIGEYKDPESRFRPQPQSPRDGVYWFLPDDEEAMSYAANVVRSAYDCRHRD